MHKNRCTTLVSGLCILQRSLTFLFLVALLTVSHASGESAVAPTSFELGEAQRWANAKLEAPADHTSPGPGLSVIANHDPVQLDSRSGRPLRIAGIEYTRGLYCHARSEVVVRLPEPGLEFTAVAGIDSNEDTTGGRGSVHFAVLVNGKELFRSQSLHEGLPGVPVKVALGGAKEFVLQVDDAGDGISCDQSDWADAKVRLQSSREIWVADLSLAQATFDQEPPFSFVYDGKPSGEFLSRWQVEQMSRELDSARLERQVVYTDDKTGLQVRCVAIIYRDFPTIEWTVYFKNTGGEATPILSDVLGLDAHFARGTSRDFILHHQLGTSVVPNDFEPSTTTLPSNQPTTFAARDGRPCSGVWPYFNLDAGNNNGVIIVIGWPGQWSATFAPGKDNGLRVTAGQKTTLFKLAPGEEIRTPLTVLQFWRGDWLRAQNVWRRWMVAHNIPRTDGELLKPLLTPCSSHQFGEMIHADQPSQELFIRRYLEEGLPIDYWWMDAGWYVNKSGWPNVGTWLVDSNRFPQGLRAITDYGHSRGVKSIVWFEPERVTPGTWLYEQHPEWLLGNGNDTKLLNLGNPQARVWLTDYIDHFLTEQGIDLYRQDYNIDPLPFWSGADAADCRGITENHYVTGYLAYWDALRQRHPGMLIDSCASGGHRNDLETMRRSVPFLRSDYIFDPVANQGMSYALAFWLPYTGTGTGPRQFSLYELRSNLSCPKNTPCWDVRDPKLPYEVLRKAVKEWRRYAPDYLGDFYPLTAYSLDNGVWMAWQFDRPDPGTGVIQAFRRSNSIYESAHLKLRGLERTAKYRLEDLDQPASTTEVLGSELLDKGVAIHIPEQPGTAVLTYHRNAP